MYDPIELSNKVEKIVVNNTLKKYYRFRPTGFYGGIATADTVGCNLRCKFCWSSNSVWNANQTGNFYSPIEVANTLQDIAYKKGYQRLRISGGEPTIGKLHLIEILKNIDPNYVFILETNGILLGHDKTYIDELSVFKNLHVRVCLKGADEEEFSIFTGAKSGFEYQINALKYLNEKQLSFNIALVSTNQDKKLKLFDRLKKMDMENVMIEEEEIKLYPLVKKRLQAENLIHHFS